MEWMATLATVIAILRLGLISCGIWVLLRSTSRHDILLDYQRKCFAIAGILYLLGLMPQSLLLLLVHSDLVNFFLDNGYLCWTQNIACVVAVALHNAIFLNWIVDSIHAYKADAVDRVTTLVKSKFFRHVVVVYVAVFILGKTCFLRREDGNRFYTDVASKTYDDEVTHWTMLPVENPSQVVRLQLLLCECSLSENEVWSFLFTSYSFLLLPLLLLCCIWKPLILRTGQFSSIKSEDDAEEDSEKGEETSSMWWEKEATLQRLLSTAITIWFYAIQPILFAVHPQHFIDFGTHLLLTICIFVPWTLSNTEYNSRQSWV